MKVCLITQVYNEQHRIIDWIKYHKKIGIDRIIVFDDLSIDGTYDLVKNYSKFDKTITLEKTDKQQQSSIFFNSGNDYAGNDIIHQRIIRSYNKGLQIIKSEWKTTHVNRYEYDSSNYEFSFLDNLYKKDYEGRSINLKDLSSEGKVRVQTCSDFPRKNVEFEPHFVIFLDVDEYISLLDSSKNIKETLTNVDFSRFDRFFLVSFDMEPPRNKKFLADKPVYEQSTMRWSDKTRFFETGWDSRTKMMVLANTCDSIWSVHIGDIRNYNQSSISILSDSMIKANEKNEYVDILKAKNQLMRILHFRDFPQAEKVSKLYDEKDETITKIMGS